MADQPLPDASGFACNMTALSPEARAEHIATSSHLLRSVQEVRELASGYAFRLPEAAETLVEAACFMAHERECCPFLSFALRVEPAEAGVWLELRGSEGVKLFLQAELGDYLSTSVAKQAGWQARTLPENRTVS